MLGEIFEDPSVVTSSHGGQLLLRLDRFQVFGATATNYIAKERTAEDRRDRRVDPSLLDIARWHEEMRQNCANCIVQQNDEIQGKANNANTKGLCCVSLNLCSGHGFHLISLSQLTFFCKNHHNLFEFVLS